jgi:hypothetical protein
MGINVPTAATTAVEAAPGSAVGSIPHTPKGVPEDVLEESEEEPKMAPESVPKVVPKEVLVEGAMIVVRLAAPSPSHGAPVASSPAPRAAATTSAAAGDAAGVEVVIGHPILYAPDDIPLDEAVSTAHRALSQAAWEQQLAEWQMRELVVTQKGWRISRHLKLEKHSASGVSWARQTLLWRPSVPALSGAGTQYQRLVLCSRFLTQPGGRYPSWRRLLAAAWRRKVMLWHRRWPTTC